MSESKKNFLTEAEIDAFLKASKTTRHKVRDYCMAIMAYRHGLRVSELVNIRLEEIDLDGARLFVCRKKGSLSTHQPIEGDELRAIRSWLRERSALVDAHATWLFLSERKGQMTRQAVNYIFAEIGKKAGLSFQVYPHMLRHSCGFALANKGLDTRLIQDLLGHKNIQHTVKYTQTNSKRFEGLWRK